MTVRTIRCVLTALLGAVIAPWPAQGTGLDLADLSLEELMEVEVTLVSRTEEPLFASAAAVYVLTGDDIRRAGVTSLPEALRLVPGMDVGHIDANKWAVSARGFSDRFAQKLLVLIDGRNVYSPPLAGVFWEMHDLLLEDVERIEVIRGPGATLWGANAVNGIVNVVTRDAAAGREARGHGAVRHGGRLGDRLGGGHYRVYAQVRDRDAFVDSSGARARDDWTTAHAGVRVDGRRGADDWMAQGAALVAETGQTYRIPSVEPPRLRPVVDATDLRSAYLLLRWRRSLSASEVRLQLYHDRDSRRDAVLDLDRRSWDVDFQHRLTWVGGCQTVWGLGYRSAFDDSRGDPAKISFAPARVRTDLFSAFAFHQLDLARTLRLSAGTKLEHNDYSAVEVQPGLRLLWQPHDDRVLWAAATRAVRTPARADHHVRIAFRSFPAEAVIPGATPDDPPVLTFFRGNPGFAPETVNAFELGGRWRTRHRVIVDAAAFLNRYADLRGGFHRVPQIVDTGGVRHVVDEIVIDNAMDATTRGGEIALDWQLPRSAGRLRATYSYLSMDFDLAPLADPASATAEGGTPNHQFLLWPSLDVRRDLQLDAILRYAGRIPDRLQVARVAAEPYLPQRVIDAFLELDLRLAWQARPHLELELVGQNLLSPHHAESADFFIDTQPTRTQRGVYAGLTWTP